MKNLQPYIQVFKKQDVWHSLFGIRLGSIAVFDLTGGVEYKNFAFELLNRQIDFINSLDCQTDDRAFELRFICRPDRELSSRGTIDVALFTKVSDGDKKASKSKALELFHDLWAMLAAFPDCYEFEYIDNAELYLALRQTFKIGNIVEILRRTDIIELETTKRLRGFGASCDEKHSNKNVHFIYPFIWSDKSFASLFSVMLYQQAPCFISIFLKPVRFETPLSDFYERQIGRCERYLTGSGGSSPVNDRVRLIAKTLQSMLLRIEDSPFVVKIRIASSGRIAKSLLDSVGVEITEHAGSPDLIKDVNDEYVFSGGYQRRCIETAEDLRQEIDELETLSFEADSSLPIHLFDANQANCAFRLPVPQKQEFPGVSTRYFKKILPPPSIPNEGIIIGRNILHGQQHYVKLTEDDRRRHMYMVGQTGTGKTTLFQRMIMQDIIQGKGVAVFDPHGELINDILARIPSERAEDVIYINFEDTERPIPFNMLEFRNDLEKEFVVGEMLDIFDKLYDLRSTGGPIFEMYMTNAMYLAMEDPESGSTLIEIIRIFEDEEFRKYKLSKCSNPYIVSFWKNTAEKAGGEASLANMVPYITSKLTKFIYNDTMRRIISCQKSAIDMREVMDQGKILLVDLCKAKLGSTNSHFLGMLLIGKILVAAMSRRDVEDKNDLRDFYLYVDEFQNLATQSFVSILSETRKYKMNVILTNQYLTQVPERVRDAIIGNVGTILSFRVGTADAMELQKKFFPIFTSFDLMYLPNRKVCMSMLANGEIVRPFEIETLPEEGLKNPDMAARLKTLSRLKYGQDANIIDAEVRRRGFLL
jgi:hypothetical protein